MSLEPQPTGFDVSREETSRALDLRVPGVVEGLIAEGLVVGFQPYRLGSADDQVDRVICLVGPADGVVDQEGDGVFGFYAPDGSKIGLGIQQWGLTVEEAQAISQRANQDAQTSF